MTDIVEQQVEVRGITRAKAPEPELGTEPISGDRYWSPEFARLEADALWTRVWQVAGRVDQIPDPGDYVTYEIGRDSVIAVRGEDHRVRVFFNVCQHRGNRLVTAEVGTLVTGEFQCAYHGWRFGDRRHASTWVPDEDDFPQGSPCGVRNLVEMPSDTWAGFIWFNMDPDAAPLREWLDPVADHLDAYRMEQMKRTHWVTVEGEFNWKCVQDNFNESYHLPYVHPQTLAVDERAPQRLPVRPLPVGPRPDADARRRPRPAVRRQARAHPQEPGGRPRVLGASTPSRTSTTSRVCASRCSRPSVSVAPTRATTSRCTPTSSSPTTTTTRCSPTSRSA